VVGRTAGRTLLCAARYAVTAAAIILLWQAVAMAVGPAVLPSPGRAFSNLFESMAHAEFWGHVAASVKRLFAGIAAAAAVGFPLGVALGQSKILDRILAPSVFMTYPIPKIVFLPVFFVMFGMGDLSRIILIALATGYQILVIVRATGRGLDPSYAAAARQMGAGFWACMRHVFLPAALPAFLTSLRVASGTATAVLFMAESFATSQGLGCLIMDAWGIGDTESMFTGIIALCALGVALYAILAFVEWLICPWTRR
jgi:ABC-type nitrate/sulfonate/bicarbonate transport system permease component